MVLVRSAEVGGDGGSGVRVKVRNAGMQGEEFLCSPLVLEADLASFLLPCETKGLLDEVVAACRGDDLDVPHSVEHRKFPNGAAP